MRPIIYDKLVFYDDSCGFCNKTVQFILRFEKNKSCCFAPIQSDFAQDFLAEKGIQVDLSTFYYVKKEKLYTKSTGFIELCTELKFPWNLLQILRIIPKVFRDYCYDFIAKRRKKIAGKFCYFPTHDEKKRFISDKKLRKNLEN